MPRFTADLRAAATNLMATADLGDRWRPIGHDWSWEDRWAIQQLYERAVEATCLEHGIYMGNAKFADTFTECLDLESWKLPEDPYVRPLLETLDWRGAAWRHGSGGFGEGVNGWLDPDETWLLEDALDKLALPHIEATVDAVRKAAHAEDFGQCRDLNQCPGRLAIIRALAEIALRNERGVLWGARDRSRPGLIRH